MEAAPRRAQGRGSLGDATAGGGCGDIPAPARGPPSWLPEPASPGCQEFGDWCFFGDFPALGNRPLAEPASGLLLSRGAGLWWPGMAQHGTGCHGRVGGWVMLCSGHPGDVGGSLPVPPGARAHPGAAGGL